MPLLKSVVRTVPLFAALALSACAGPMLTQDSARTIPIEGLYSYGAGDRDLQLVVRGNPFAVPQPLFDRAVEAGVAQGGILQPPTHPKLAPGDTARPGYQFVLVFAPAPTLDAADACAGKGGGGGQPDGRVDALAVFCASGRAVSYISGRVTAAGIDDPAFTALLQGIGQAVFRRDEFQGGNGDVAP